LQLNDQAINLLRKALSPNVEALILKEYEFPEDAHLLWKAIVTPQSSRAWRSLLLTAH
jgi:hypothetical protein